MAYTGEVRRRWLAWFPDNSGFFKLECGHTVMTSFRPNLKDLPKELYCEECSRQEKERLLKACNLTEEEIKSIDKAYE